MLEDVDRSIVTLFRTAIERQIRTTGELVIREVGNELRMQYDHGLLAAGQFTDLECGSFFPPHSTLTAAFGNALQTSLGGRSGFVSCRVFLVSGNQRYTDMSCFARFAVQWRREGLSHSELVEIEQEVGELVTATLLHDGLPVV